MMKSKTILKKSLLFVLLSGVLISGIGWGEDVKDRPDSIHYIMGVKVDDNQVEELDGKEVTLFKFYGHSTESYIVWLYQKNYYVYAVTGTGHIQQAMELFKQLQTFGLETFVAYREGRSLKFNKYLKVIAIHISAQKK